MLTAIGGGYYRVYRDGVEFSKHTQERECIESAYKCKADYPCARVTYRHEYEVEVAKVPVARTFERDAEGDGYCYSRPPDDGEGPSAPVLSGTANDNDIILTWTPAIDALSGLSGYELERAPVGNDSWSVIASPAADATEATDSDVGYQVSWRYRIVGYDNAPTPNKGTYSNIVTVTTPASAAQLQPGQISLSASSYSVGEGVAFSVDVTRVGAGTSAPTVEVDYTFSGFSGGTPTPVTDTLTWVGTDTNPKQIIATAGNVSSNVTGSLTLSNVRALTGSLQPTLGTANASVTIFNSSSASMTFDAGFGGSGTIQHGQAFTITGTGFGTKAQAAPVLWDFGNDVWENGEQSSRHSSLSLSAVVPEGNSGAGDVYNIVSSLRFDNSNLRHARVARHYMNTAAEDGFLKQPFAAQGAKSTSSPENRWYLSWWQWFSGPPVRSGTGYMGSLKTLRWGPIANSTMRTFTRMNVSEWQLIYRNSGGTDTYIQPRSWSPGLIETYPASMWPRWFFTECWYWLDSSGRPNVRILVDNSLGATSGPGQAAWASDTNWTFDCLGMDATEAGGIVTKFGEVYFDNSCKRIMVGNASTYSACTILERQRLTAWGNTEISWNWYQGSLPTFAGMWVYAVDVNTSGAVVATRIGQVNVT